jgi:hypothetical protein
MKHRISKKLLIASLALFFADRSFAQPFSLDERVKPTELNLVDYKKTDTLRKGRINITEVTQHQDTSYYFIKALSMYSPVYVGLTAKPEAGNIKINLCKDNWHAINRNGETGDKGHWQDIFKTEGDFGIMVIADKKPADYTLVVWVGDEAKDVGITSPFKDKDSKSGTAANKGGSFLKDNLMYIIIGLLVIVIGFLFYKMKKNKS